VIFVQLTCIIALYFYG